MNEGLHPLLYQVNTRVRLTELSRSLGRRATLDDFSDAELDGFRDLGFDWIWLLSVWHTGPAARKVSQSSAQWRREFKETLPDLDEADIDGSGFAVAAYEVHPDLGGPVALAHLRERMKKRGLKLMLDFVPNHMGLDHPWVGSHPDYFVAGSEGDLQAEPQNYTRVKLSEGEVVRAYGRDPYFSGWPDTLQLDYSNPATQEAMVQELLKISQHCDGVRCDMAMLLLPDVFERTWGTRPADFWPDAIARVQDAVEDFCFIAEVYWGLEWTLQQQGFDYTYDKRLYDRLRDREARPVREYLHASLDYQMKSVRFLENHDEPRAAATFECSVHRAAAVLTYFVPGLRFFQQGQVEGRKVHVSPHLVRAPEEPVDLQIRSFYTRLLSVLGEPTVRTGEWQALACRSAWEGNASDDAIIAHAWRGAKGEQMLVVVNYAAHHSQAYLELPFSEFQGGSIEFKDLLGPDLYVRDGDGLCAQGLYLDLPPWQAHIFRMVVKH